MTVTGKQFINENTVVGSYGQPSWTATPRFLTTSIYVVPDGEFEFDYWNDFKYYPKYKDYSVFEQTFEMEMGMGHRLQFDAYIGTQKIGDDGPINLSHQGFEIRYALADYGKIWSNPSIYLDLENRSQGYPEFEAKLLLGGDLAPHWHIGSNFIFERELKKTEPEQAYTATLAISYTVIDPKFSVGLEFKGTTEAEPEIVELAEVEEEGAEDAAEEEEEEEEEGFGEAYGLYAGPSIQWRPVPQMYISFAMLFGTERQDEQNVQVYEPLLVAGWEF